MQKCDEALPSIILAGDQFTFHTFLLAAETNLSTFNKGCALYCQLIHFLISIFMKMFEIRENHMKKLGSTYKIISN